MGHGRTVRKEEVGSQMTEKITKFFADRIAEGYDVQGSVLKIDYTGKRWTVGVWLRPALWNNNSQEYDLQGFCERVRGHSMEFCWAELMHKWENQ